MKKKINLLIALAINCLVSQAQQNNGIAPFFHNNMYSFNTLQKIELHNFFNNYQADLGTTANDSFAVQHINYLADKKFDCRYLQYHKGYLVDGTSFVLHGQSNVVLHAAGNQIKNLNVNVSSPISESAALATAVSHFSGYTFDYQVDSILGALKEAYGDSSYSNLPVGSLVISKARNAAWESSNYKLTWKFQLNIVHPTDSNITVYVDAITGTIRDVYDRSDYAHYGTGTVQTIYNGTQNFRTWKCTTCSKWKLNSDVGGYHSITSLLNGKYIKDGDNSWSDYTEQNATTVHWATERAYAYFKNRHGRAGSDNKGALLTNDCNLGIRYASYLEDGKADKIKVGGRISGVSPAALDVLSHEYAHAFIRRNPNLNMYFEDRESGALNEGFADIFGLLSERYTVGSTNWKIGEETIAYPLPSVRDFSNPHLSTLHSGVGQPKKYQESGYWDFSNVNKHKNAGVLTHWFYLLSQGGTYNGVTVPAIGIETADDIAFVSMMWWLWSSVNFEDTKNQSIAATIAHWGKCSKEHKSVVRAWAAVGLGSSYVPDCWRVWLNGEHVINQVELVAKVAKFKLSLSPDEPPAPINPETIDWIIPSGWSTSISPDKTELTVHSIANMDSKELMAVISNGNNTFDTLKHVVHVVNYIDSASISNPEAFMRKTIENEGSVTTSTQFLVYPNPANDFVNIFIGDEEANLEIFNLMGVKVSSMQLKNPMNTINVGDLSNGSYIFKITSKQHQQAIHFNINH